MSKKPVCSLRIVCVLGAFWLINNVLPSFTGARSVYAQVKQPASEHDIRWDTGRNIDQLLQRVNERAVDGWQVTRFHYQAYLDKFTLQMQRGIGVKPKNFEYNLYWDSRENINRLLQRVNRKAANGWVARSVSVESDKLIFFMERDVRGKAQKTKYDFHWDAPRNIRPLLKRVNRKTADGWSAQSIDAPNLIVFLMVKKD